MIDLHYAFMANILILQVYRLQPDLVKADLSLRSRNISNVDVHNDTASRIKICNYYRKNKL